VSRTTTKIICLPVVHAAMVEAESDDPLRPGRLLLLGGLLAIVFLLLFVMIAVQLFGLTP